MAADAVASDNACLHVSATNKAHAFLRPNTAPAALRLPKTPQELWHHIRFYPALPLQGYLAHKKTPYPGTLH